MTPSSVEPLLAKIDACVWALGQGRDVPGAEIQRCVDALLEGAAVAGAEDLSRLSGRLDALTLAVRAVRDGMQVRLTGLGAGRRALHGYIGQAGRTKGRPA